MNAGQKATPTSSLLALLAAACLGIANSVWAQSAAYLRPEKLAEMDAAIEEAISEARCPG